RNVTGVQTCALPISGTWAKDVVLVVHKLTRQSANKPIDDISFLVRKGQCVGIFGFKGAGKSSLVRILIGKSVFDSGNFYLDQLEIGRASWRGSTTGS